VAGNITSSGLTVNNSITCNPQSPYGGQGYAMVNTDGRIGGWFVDGNHFVIYVDGTQVGINFYISDETVKKNIAPSTYNALDTVNKIEFKSFDYDEEKTFARGHFDCGVTSQQLQKVDPSLVSEIGDLLQPNPDRLLYIAMKAIQELEAKVAALEAQTTKG
jgi:hypothetical protein